MERLRPLPWQLALWRQLAGARERMPHALLLHGARGTGKRHFIRTLAEALLCESPAEDGSPCGQCAGCQLNAADNHPDLRWLVPEIDQPLRDAIDEGGEVELATGTRPAKASREIKIDQVRALVEFLAIAAHRGGRRVVVLAPVEALNGPAANALLKLLEEPPAGALFLGVTDELDAVLPTVRSRSVLLRAPSPTTIDALAWLRSEGVENAEEALAEAGGAPVGIAAPDADDARRLTAELKAQLLELLARGARLRPADVLVLPKDTPLGESIRLFQRWGWDLLAERTAKRVRYYPKQQRAVAAVARDSNPERLLGWLGQLADAQATADHPLNAKLAVEGLLVSYISAIQPA
jgi:DNA polymerase-3 subunit delta'